MPTFEDAAQNEGGITLLVDQNPFVASWSAKGNTLCLGHWKISYKEMPLTLPTSVGETYMDTFGIFSWLYPDDEDYAEGLLIDEWIDEKASWIIPLFEQHNIPFDAQHLEWFYESINAEDWRCGSCGGCL